MTFTEAMARRNVTTGMAFTDVRKDIQPPERVQLNLRSYSQEGATYTSLGSTPN